MNAQVPPARFFTTAAGSSGTWGGLALGHLLGIDHTRLTFRHNGIDRRLTDVHGHAIKEILA